MKWTREHIWPLLPNTLFLDDLGTQACLRFFIIFMQCAKNVVFLPHSKISGSESFECDVHTYIFNSSPILFHVFNYVFDVENPEDWLKFIKNFLM